MMMSKLQNTADSTLNNYNSYFWLLRLISILPFGTAASKTHAKAISWTSAKDI